MPGLTGALRKRGGSAGGMEDNRGSGGLGGHGFCGVLIQADTRCTLYLLHSGSWQVSFVAALAAEVWTSPATFLARRNGAMDKARWAFLAKGQRSPAAHVKWWKTADDDVDWRSSHSTAPDVRGSSIREAGGKENSVKLG